MNIIIILIIVCCCCLCLLGSSGYYFISKDETKQIDLSKNNKQDGSTINNNTSIQPKTTLDNAIQGQISTTTPIPATTPTTTPATALYPFTSHTFTNAKAIGRFGPKLSDIKTAYSSASWSQNNKYLNMINDNGIQLWTVPKTGNYKIQAVGAAGMNPRKYCKGRDIEVTTTLNKDEIIRILVGQMGSKGAYNNQSGGGGGTFVIRGSQIPPTAILVAGGGGGSSDNNYDNEQNANSNAAAPNTGNGNDGCEGGGKGGSSGSGGNAASVHSSGGGGLTGDGVGIPAYTALKSQAKSFTNGGAGAEPETNRIVGGFGGGGCSNNGASGGGGGGYSGGGGGSGASAIFNGGGGGSYSSITNFTDNGATNSDHGKVTITFVE